MGEFASTSIGASRAGYTPASAAGAVQAAAPSGAAQQQKEAAEAFTAELLRAVGKQWLQAMHLPREVAWAAEDVMTRQMAKAVAPNLMPSLFPANDPLAETKKG